MASSLSMLCSVAADTGSFDIKLDNKGSLGSDRSKSPDSFGNSCQDLNLNVMPASIDSNCSSQIQKNNGQTHSATHHLNFIRSSELGGLDSLLEPQTHSFGGGKSVDYFDTMVSHACSTGSFQPEIENVTSNYRPEPHSSWDTLGQSSRTEDTPGTSNSNSDSRSLADRMSQISLEHMAERRSLSNSGLVCKSFASGDSPFHGCPESFLRSRLRNLKNTQTDHFERHHDGIKNKACMSEDKNPSTSHVDNNQRDTASVNTPQITSPKDKGNGQVYRSMNKDQDSPSHEDEEDKMSPQRKQCQMIIAAYMDEEQGRFTKRLEKSSSDCEQYLDDTQESTSRHGIGKQLSVSTDGNKGNTSISKYSNIVGRSSAADANTGQRGASAPFSIDDGESINKTQLYFDEIGATTQENNEQKVATSHEIKDQGKAPTNVTIYERGATASGANINHADKVRISDHQISTGASYQKQDWSKSANEILCIDDHPLKGKRYFAAYMCVAGADLERFGKQFHAEIEQWGFRILLPVRDLLASGFHLDNISWALEERCQGKIIIVLSKNFESSSECTFIAQYARTLDPDLQKRNLIPVVIDEECHTPRSLAGVTFINYNHNTKRRWLKKRMADAIFA